MTSLRMNPEPWQIEIPTSLLLPVIPWRSGWPQTAIQVVYQRHCWHRFRCFEAIVCNINDEIYSYIDNEKDNKIWKKLIFTGVISYFQLFKKVWRWTGDLNARVWHYATCRYLYHEMLFSHMHTLFLWFLHNLVINQLTICIFFIWNKEI